MDGKVFIKGNSYNPGDTKFQIWCHPWTNSLHWSHFQAWLVSCHNWVSAHNSWSKSILCLETAACQPQSSQANSAELWELVDLTDGYASVYASPLPPFSHSLSLIYGLSIGSCMYVQSHTQISMYIYLKMHIYIYICVYKYGWTVYVCILTEREYISAPVEICIIL